MLTRRALSSKASSKAAALGKLFMERPCSLEVASEGPEDSHSENAPFLIKIALKMGGFYSTQSTNQRAADRLYAAISAQAEDPALMDALEIEQSFRGSHGMLTLHVWLVLKRLRGTGDAGKSVSQVMYDTFQDDVEYRVHAEGVRVRVNKWLNELEKGFYGSSLAYDTALKGEKGDLAKVLHRNVFHGEGDVDRSRTLERYVRRELGCLSMTDGAAVLEGRIKFSDKLKS